MLWILSLQIANQVHKDKGFSDCTDWAMRLNYKVAGPLSVDMENFHEIHYDLTQDSRNFFKLDLIERHSVSLKAKEKGSTVGISLTLKHLDMGRC